MNRKIIAGFITAFCFNLDHNLLAGPEDHACPKFVCISPASGGAEVYVIGSKPAALTLGDIQIHLSRLGVPGVQGISCGPNLHYNPDYLWIVAGGRDGNVYFNTVNTKGKRKVAGVVLRKTSRDYMQPSPQIGPM